MITTRAMPAPLPAHHRRVATEAAIKNDFADPLGPDPLAMVSRLTESAPAAAF